MPHQAGPLQRATARLPRDIQARLTRLEATNPEWQPLLAAVRETLAGLEASPSVACIASAASADAEREDPPGGRLTMARSILEEWRLACASPGFRSWLASGAPSEDR